MLKVLSWGKIQWNQLIYWITTRESTPLLTYSCSSITPFHLSHSLWCCVRIRVHSLLVHIFRKGCKGLRIHQTFYARELEAIDYLLISEALKLKTIVNANGGAYSASSPLG